MFVVINKERIINKTDVLDKTHDQMKKLDESLEDRRKRCKYVIKKIIKVEICGKHKQQQKVV